MDASRPDTAALCARRLQAWDELGTHSQSPALPESPSCGWRAWGGAQAGDRWAVCRVRAWGESRKGCHLHLTAGPTSPDLREEGEAQRPERLLGTEGAVGHLANEPTPLPWSRLASKQAALDSMEVFQLTSLAAPLLVRNEDTHVMRKPDRRSWSAESVIRRGICKATRQQGADAASGSFSSGSSGS